MRTFDNIWEEVHKEREWGKYPSEDIIRFVARNYYGKKRNEIKVLDIGCGQDANTWYLAKEKFDAYGFDGSESAVKKAKKRLENEGLSAELIVADAANLPYKDNFFDCIIDGAVIYANTIDGIETILKEMYRVNKVGGKIFSTGLFNLKTTGHGSGEKLETNTERNLKDGALSGLGTVHFFNHDEIFKLWSEAGFKDIKIDTLERTEYNGKYTIGYYIVEAVKK